MTLDVHADHNWIDLLKRIDTLQLAPREELGDGLRVRGTCVPVPDSGGEKLDEAPRGSFARSHNYRRKVLKSCAREIAARDWNVV
jgi:hypothetical protein